MSAAHAVEPRNGSGAAAADIRPATFTLGTLVLILMTVAGISLCALLAAPFLGPITFALTFAVLFKPLQIWLERRFKNTSLAALACVLLIGLIVVVPATFVAQRLGAQAVRAAQLIQARVSSGEFQRAIEAEPRLASVLATVQQHVDVPGALQTVSGALSGKLADLLRGSAVQIVGFVLTFYLLFFFLRDRQTALDALRSLMPLTQPEADHLFAHAKDTMHATVYGTLAVAAVQGALGGLMFWWLGLPAPLLWGVVMAVLAVVPVLGAFIVWLPAAGYLVLQDCTGSALILALWGVFVIGTIDNLLRPMLVGNRLQLHTLLSFLSLVGGLLLFGTAGLILGPLALSITMVLLEIWPQRAKKAAALPSDC